MAKLKQFPDPDEFPSKGMLGAKAAPKEKNLPEKVEKVKKFRGPKLAKPPGY